MATPAGFENQIKLRGAFKQHEYRFIMLPTLVLIGPDAVLAKPKQAVERAKTLDVTCRAPTLGRQPSCRSVALASESNRTDGALRP